jgi:hypothetical protein
MNPRAMLAVAYATGRASHARQVKGDDPDEKGYPAPTDWGLGMGLTTPNHKKKFVLKPNNQPRKDGYCEIYKSSKDKMAGTFKENGSGSNAKKDDGRKTVHRKKKRKTLFEMDG